MEIMSFPARERYDELEKDAVRFYHHAVQCVNSLPPNFLIGLMLQITSQLRDSQNDWAIDFTSQCLLRHLAEAAIPSAGLFKKRTFSEIKTDDFVCDDEVMVGVDDLSQHLVRLVDLKKTSPGALDYEKVAELAAYYARERLIQRKKKKLSVKHLLEHLSEERVGKADQHFGEYWLPLHWNLFQYSNGTLSLL